MATFTRRKGLFGRYYHYDRAVVTVGAAAGSVSISFFTDYDATPHIFVMKPEGAAGTYSYGNESKGGFSLQVTSETDSDFQNKDVGVFFFSHGK